MDRIKLIKKDNLFTVVMGDNILIDGINTGHMASIINNKRKSKKYQELEGNLSIFAPKWNINFATFVIKTQYMHMKPKFEAIQAEKTVDEFIPLENTSFDEIKPDEFEEVIAVSILSGYYPLRNPIWLKLLASPSVGKSEKLMTFNNSEIVHWCGKQTKNVALSGKPNKDADDPYSSFVEANEKCMIYNDVAVLLGGSEDTLKNILGLMTDAYGKDMLTIEDPGGRREYKSHFSIIMGMTRKQARELSFFINKMGQRFLIYEIPTDFEKCYYDQDDRGRVKHNKRRDLLVSHIMNTKVKYKQLPRYSDEMRAEAREYAMKIVKLRTLCWESYNEKTLEHYQRLMNILLNAASIRASLWDREPTVDDLKFFFPLATSTIYRNDLLKKFFNDGDINHFRSIKDKWHTTLVSNLHKLKILDEHDDFKTNEFSELFR